MTGVVCGNGLCEIGELCNAVNVASEDCCPQDCPFASPGTSGRYTFNNAHRACFWG